MVYLLDRSDFQPGRIFCAAQRYGTPRLVWLRDDAVIVSRALATDPEDTFEVVFWTPAEFDKIAQAVEDQANSIN